MSVAQREYKDYVKKYRRSAVRIVLLVAVIFFLIGFVVGHG